MAIVLVERADGGRVFCGLDVKGEQCEEMVQVRVTLLLDGLVTSTGACKYHAGQMVLDSADWVETEGRADTPWFG